MFSVLRFFFRFLGCLLIATAVVALIADGSRSIAQSTLSILTAGELWQLVSSATYKDMVEAVSADPAFAFLSAILLYVLSGPVWVVFSVLGMASLWLGRRRFEKASALAF
ncbi:hypothetical protein [Roseibium sp.]|uniref:hypothetical protein n=1 Tax=Roseibium sp. TaxID=1936156 RepID=UPI003A977B47